MSMRDRDLYKKHDELIRLKKETYEKIYSRCCNIIKASSDAGELLCIYEIPNFLFGTSYPIIDIVSCANYLMNRLTRANKHFKAAFFHPNLLFIDWRREKDMDFRKSYMPIKEPLNTTESKSKSKSRSKSKSKSRSNKSRSDNSHTSNTNNTSNSSNTSNTISGFTTDTSMSRSKSSNDTTMSTNSTPRKNSRL